MISDSMALKECPTIAFPAFLVSSSTVAPEQQLVTHTHTHTQQSKSYMDMACKIFTFTFTFTYGYPLPSLSYVYTYMPTQFLEGADIIAGCSLSVVPLQLGTEICGLWRVTQARATSTAGLRSSSEASGTRSATSTDSHPTLLPSPARPLDTVEARLSSSGSPTLRTLPLTRARYVQQPPPPTQGPACPPATSAAKISTQHPCQTSALHRAARVDSSGTCCRELWRVAAQPHVPYFKQSAHL